MMIMMVMMRGGGCFEPITEAVDYIIEDVDNYFEIKNKIKDAVKNYLAVFFR